MRKYLALFIAFILVGLIWWGYARHHSDQQHDLDEINSLLEEKSESGLTNSSTSHESDPVEDSFGDIDNNPEPSEEYAIYQEISTVNFSPSKVQLKWVKAMEYLLENRLKYSPAITAKYIDLRDSLVQEQNSTKDEKEKKRLFYVYRDRLRHLLGDIHYTRYLEVKHHFNKMLLKNPKTENLQIDF